MCITYNFVDVRTFTKRSRSWSFVLWISPVDGIPLMNSVCGISLISSVDGIPQIISVDGIPLINSVDG